MNAECELRLAIKSRSHRHGAGGELKSTPFETSSLGSTKDVWYNEPSAGRVGVGVEEVLARLVASSCVSSWFRQTFPGAEFGWEDLPLRRLCRVHLGQLQPCRRG